MKRLVAIILISFLCHAVVGATSSDAERRMLRYSTLHQLFDAPLAAIGISEISQMYAVDLWDFDYFSGYIMEGLQDLQGPLPGKCDAISDSKTLVIDLSGKIGEDCPLRARDLTIRFIDDADDAGKSLEVSYTLPATSETPATLRQECVDLLQGLEASDADGGAFAYEGPYGHLYTITEGVDGASVAFSCRMPVPAYKWYSVPVMYVPGLSYDHLPDSAPCNMGTEPFSEFIEKFNSDAKFRVDRRNWSDAANHADLLEGHLSIQFGFNEYVIKALGHSGLLPLHGHYDYREVSSMGESSAGDFVERCGQWFYPTQNRVIYSGWSISGATPEDDCGIVVLFERIDGIWYTTATWYSGQRFDNEVRRVMQEGGVE